MKKCSHCGAGLKDGAKSCPKCGAAVSTGRFLKEPAPKKKSWVWLPIVLMVALAAVAAVFVLQGKHDEPLMQQTEPSTLETTTAPTTEATEPPTTEETEPPTEPAPVYRNPLNGTLMDAPFEGRIYMSTISNVPDALPHVSANKADIVFETFVNYSIIRMVGLFTNIAEAETIGSVRSTRIMFNDITQHYDAVLFHAGGSSQVLQDVKTRGIDNFSVDTWDASQAGVSIRDEQRRRFIGWEHCLLALGPQIESYAASQGIETKGDPEKDYLLRFAEEATPEGGEAATDITITITQGSYKKDTVLNYDPELGKYVYSQYGKVMEDGATGEKEAYTNIIIMEANISMQGMYQCADFVAGGNGYFACGGQLIPIVWSCDGEDQPFRFCTTDGQDLTLAVGNTYIAITQPDFKLSYS